MASVLVKIFSFKRIISIIGLVVIVIVLGSALTSLQSAFAKIGPFGFKLNGKPANDVMESLRTLSVDRAELEILRKENENLKLMIGYFSNSSQEIKSLNIAARVIAREINPMQSNVVIDKGSNDGVKEGYPAIVENGIVIGKITSVRKYFSTITLLSDAQSRIGSTILGNSETIGIVQGSGGSLLHFKYIPKNSELAVNMPVVTSGIDQNVKSGLIIGIVNSVIDDGSSPFKEAIIQPPVDYRVYSYVTIIPDPELIANDL